MLDPRQISRNSICTTGFSNISTKVVELHPFKFLASCKFEIYLKYVAEAIWNRTVLYENVIQTLMALS